MGSQSMRERAQQFGEQQERKRSQGITTSADRGIAPIVPFAEPTYGIVGRDVVRAHYATNTPGYSETIVASEIREGWTSPVSVGEIRLFPSLEQALFVRDQEQLGALANPSGSYEQARR